MIVFGHLVENARVQFLVLFALLANLGVADHHLIGGRLVVSIKLENRLEMFLGVLQLVDAQKCLQMERQNL
jgi:hypothetical protein